MFKAQKSKGFGPKVKRILETGFWSFSGHQCVAASVPAGWAGCCGKWPNAERLNSGVQLFDSAGMCAAVFDGLAEEVKIVGRIGERRGDGIYGGQVNLQLVFVFLEVHSEFGGKRVAVLVELHHDPPRWQRQDWRVPGIREVRALVCRHVCGFQKLAADFKNRVHGDATGVVVDDEVCVGVEGVVV